MYMLIQFILLISNLLTQLSLAQMLSAVDFFFFFFISMQGNGIVCSTVRRLK